MIYVMSDIHGQYQTFLKMLKLISFNDNDTLYILGDIIDRGFEVVEIYNYIVSHKNIHLIMGNHEKMMIDYLKLAKSDIEKEIDLYKLRHQYHFWMRNGGFSTLKQFDEMDNEQQENFYKFFSSLPYYKIVNLNNKIYILCHSGIDFNSNKSIKENLDNNVKNENILWNRKSDYNNIPNDVILVHGHTPVQSYFYCENSIVKYMNNNVINIDCGCAGELKLACLRLNDMKEFYVDCN